jgi:hypothetical protein
MRVTWECAECNASEGRGVRIDAVCHHCGKPLCRDDRLVIADVAFAPTAGEMDQTAVHCRLCGRQHHSRFDIPLGASDQ